MTRLALPDQTTRNGMGDAAMARALRTEDVVVGDEIIGHIYLGTAAEPGTFRSMIRGTVTKSWARLHHPRWYREVTSEQPRG